MYSTCGWTRVKSRSFLVRLDQAAKPITLIHQPFNILLAHEHADLKHTTPVQGIALLISILQLPSKQSGGAPTMAVSDAVTKNIRPDVEEETLCFFWKLPLEVRDIIYELLYGQHERVRVIIPSEWETHERTNRRRSGNVASVSHENGELSIVHSSQTLTLCRSDHSRTQC